MDADDLVHRHRKGIEGIIGAKVCLQCEGELVQVIDGPDIGRGDARLPHFLGIIRHIVVNPLHRIFQPFAL